MPRQRQTVHRLIALQRSGRQAVRLAAPGKRDASGITLRPLRCPHPREQSEQGDKANPLRCYRARWSRAVFENILDTHDVTEHVGRDLCLRTCIVRSALRCGGDPPCNVMRSRCYIAHSHFRWSHMPLSVRPAFVRGGDLLSSVTRSRCYRAHCLGSRIAV